MTQQKCPLCLKYFECFCKEYEEPGFCSTCSFFKKNTDDQYEIFKQARKNKSVTYEGKIKKESIHSINYDENFKLRFDKVCHYNFDVPFGDLTSYMQDHLILIERKINILHQILTTKSN